MPMDRSDELEVDGKRVRAHLDCSAPCCVQAFIVRATQPVGCVRALGEAKVAQGKEPCGRPRWPVWGASEIREHAHACIGSLICTVMNPAFGIVPKGGEAECAGHL